MSGNPDDYNKLFDGIQEKPPCLHRSIQLCKEQNETFVAYVCGRCSTKFKVEAVPEDIPQPKDPMFAKNPIPWGLRGRQA